LIQYTTSHRQVQPNYMSFFSRAILLALVIGIGVTANAQNSADSSASGKTDSYEPITPQQRIRWLAKGTAGPQSLLTGIFVAGIGTARNSPHEYGPHWDGFGKRYGMRLANNGVTNTMEAGLGAIWGEDPRYFRCTESDFHSRVHNVVKQTFFTRRPDGDLAPAYARFIAIPSSSFLSNTWRPDSKAHNDDAAVRIAYGFLGRMGGNAFREFWPDVSKHIFRRKH
jgi:hypothetical protein